MISSRLYVCIPVYQPNPQLFTLHISSLLSEIRRVTVDFQASVVLLISLNDKNSSSKLFESILVRRLMLLNLHNKVDYAFSSHLQNPGYPNCFIRLIEAATLFDSSLSTRAPNTLITFLDQDDYLLPGRLILHACNELHFSSYITSNCKLVASKAQGHSFVLDRPPSAGMCMTLSIKLASYYLATIYRCPALKTLPHDLAIYLCSLEINILPTLDKAPKMIYIQHENQTIPIPSILRLAYPSFLLKYINRSLRHLALLSVVLSQMSIPNMPQARLSRYRIKRIVLKSLLAARGS